jgi:hypothetical protein
MSKETYGLLCIRAELREVQVDGFLDLPPVIHVLLYVWIDAPALTLDNILAFIIRVNRTVAGVK